MSALLVYDVETSGLVDFKRPVSDPAQPRLVQLGAVLYDGKQQEVASICLLVRPEGWVSNSGARNIHAIPQSRSERYGVRAKAALSAFMDLVRAADEIAAYNAEFDERVVDIELDRLRSAPIEWKRAGLKRTCVMIDAGQIANDGKNLKLPAAHLALTGQKYVPTHNGLDDARAAARILFAIRDRGVAA